MSELRAGDLAVVVAHATDVGFADMPRIYGHTVVLVAMVPTDQVMPNRRKFAPYWRVSGLPDGLIWVPHMNLRKIPPAPMDDEIPTLTEAVA